MVVFHRRVRAATGVHVGYLVVEMEGEHFVVATLNWVGRSLSRSKATCSISLWD